MTLYMIGFTSTRRLLDRVVWTAFSLCILTSAAIAENPLPDVERLKSSPVLRHLQPNPMPVPTSPTRTPGEQTLAQMYLPEDARWTETQLKDALVARY